ncbi:ornithine cyclodeaminase family protein [Heyndrickxia oleronia]|uniref:Ornithine cyclodeaminase n=1 Tax=Heyndrickxia oleronia TaxID=38875 RepID=A0A8E2I3C1_9BACI|nr:ornithine cyclodeaminase [Heyndrickxia oleronia]NYV67353.1 ornithine cyclodeaminase family protein [Bacillus sp. Gen3]OJH19956.1 ornithine cyclodeaminase [Bacillus obstructivus]MBU5213759.1 ornithine cyclodeaminase family protein [Heyndrickxia oleronia]MEC1375099.1 ornithine cyclodeaminase family protein [Heyndrickxia oleronia]OOP65936.1 ornithine cyclodeaminase [Heyndrickxia oleronia]
MLILSEKEIRTLYSMEDAIQDLEEALLFYKKGEIINPERTVIEFPTKHASALYMPSAMDPIGKAAVKIVTIFPHNPSKGKSTTQGVILLNDTNSGEPLACLNASYLTRLRTGAVSGIATKYLAKETASTVTLIGCGAMAESQLQAILFVRNIKEVYLFNRTKIKAEQFAEKIKDISPWYKGTVSVVEDVNEAVSKSDIIICSTRSETPVFLGEVLKPGTHINGVGSYLPHMQEVDVNTLLKCSKIVVDTLEGSRTEAGDFIIPERAGLWSFSELHGELGDLVSRDATGRETDEEITFFKSVGIAYFDLAVAANVYEKAVSKGIGTQVDI